MLDDFIVLMRRLEDFNSEYDTDYKATIVWEADERGTLAVKQFVVSQQQTEGEC